MPAMAMSNGRVVQAVRRLLLRHLRRTSVLKQLVSRGSLLFVLAASSVAFAQATDRTAISRPDHPLVEVTYSHPIKMEDASIQMLLKVRSLTGSAMELAYRGGHPGWSAYCSSGNFALGDALRSDSLPWLTGQGKKANDILMTAGVGTPAYVPMRLLGATQQCQKGEKITVTVVLLVGFEGQWRPQQFSFAEEVIK